MISNLEIFQKLKNDLESTINIEVDFNDWSNNLNDKLKKLKQKNTPLKVFFKDFVDFIEQGITFNDEDTNKQIFRWAVKQSFTQLHNKSRKRSYLPKENTFSHEFKKTITPKMNSARGEIYEQMALAVLLKVYKDEFKEKNIKVIKQKRFKVEDNKARIIDIWLEPINTAIEVKSGRVFLSSHIRKEIEKDAILIKKGLVKEYWWMLFYGASQSVIKSLENNGIKIIDMGFKKNDD